jgi:hypothetical protein
VESVSLFLADYSSVLLVVLFIILQLNYSCFVVGEISFA